MENSNDNKTVDLIPLLVRDHAFKFSVVFCEYANNMNDKTWDDAMQVFADFKKWLDKDKNHNANEAYVFNDEGDTEYRESTSDRLQRYMNNLKEFNGSEVTSWSTVDDIVSILNSLGCSIADSSEAE